jgi:hypothetical protein
MFHSYFLREFRRQLEHSTHNRGLTGRIWSISRDSSYSLLNSFHKGVRLTEKWRMPCSTSQLLHSQSRLLHHRFLKPKRKRLITLAIQVADRNLSVGRFRQRCLLSNDGVRLQLRSPELLFRGRQIVVEDMLRIDRIATSVRLNETTLSIKERGKAYLEPTSALIKGASSPPRAVQR